MGSAIFYLLFAAFLYFLAYLGWHADCKSFMGSLFAAALSVFTVVFVERELRPKIRIVKEEIAPVVNDRKFLRVIVENQAIGWPLKLIMDRRPAYQARATIEFLTVQNQPVFARIMLGRWSGTPEPVRPIFVSQTAGGPQIGYIRDASIIRDAIDIGSGGSELLDIVMRLPGEEGCRGWNNQIIVNDNATPQDNFELPRGRYHILVEVNSSGRSFKAKFRIVCDIGIEDFRLENI
jgi:hypothetical protein